MTLADLTNRLAWTADVKVRWTLVWEFLEEHRWEPAGIQPSLLRDEPGPIGNDRSDTLLAALAEHLAAGQSLARRDGDTRAAAAVVPAELELQRTEALVWAPAAFRKHGVYLSARDLESP